jgi:hypothetical protein
LKTHRRFAGKIGGMKSQMAIGKRRNRENARSERKAGRSEIAA